MPFDGNGNFDPPSPAYPAIPDTVIMAADWNEVIQDLADGLTNCITRDGQSPPTANISWGSRKLTTLANGTNTNDAINFGQVLAGTTTFPDGTRAVTQAVGDGSTKLATTAFVMSTAFVAALPGQAGNAGKFVRTDGANASWANVPMNRVINGLCLISQYGSKVIAAASSVFGGCDRFISGVTGTTVAATIQRAVRPVAGIGSQGFCQQITATTTGATGSVSWATRLESIHVADLNSKTVTFSANVYQDTGVTINFTASLSKANALNNFGTVTLLATGAATPVPTGTVTNVKVTVVLGAADATNGILIIFGSAAFAAVTAKNFYTSDWFFDEGSIVPSTMPYVDISTELIRCQRYYWPVTGEAAGISANTTQSVFCWNLPVEMRTTPTFAAVSVSNQFLTTAASAIAGTWTSSNLAAKAVAATFTRTAGTWTAAAPVMLQDAAGTIPFTLSAEL